MVTANCWYIRPVMPGMNAVGMNTAAMIRAMATTGPDTSSIAFKAASRGDSPSLDVVLDGLHHDDRVVDDEADGQHEAEERQRVDRESQQRKDHERADQRHRHRQQRDEGGPEALQEDEHDDDHEDEGLDERLDDLPDARAHRQRRVERRHVVEVGGESRLDLAPSASSRPSWSSMALEPGSW